jgi:hypothetical protein
VHCDSFTFTVPLFFSVTRQGCCSKQNHKLFAGADRLYVKDRGTVEGLILAKEMGSEGHLDNKVPERADSNRRTHDNQTLRLGPEGAKLVYNLHSSL